MYFISDLHPGKLQNRLVVLDCAADIVRFSFVAQNSISYLDLAQQREGDDSDYDLIGLSIHSIVDPTIRHSQCVINTDEKCRKTLSMTRGFLYRLHLDLPKKREYSLRDDHEIENMTEDFFSQHIGKVIVHPNFYFTVLSCLVKEAVQRSDQKLKLIKFLVTLDAVAEDAFLNPQDALYFSKCMYPEVTEPAFVEAFLKRLPLRSWIIENDTPELLEFFLYHLCGNKSIFMRNRISRYELIDLCFIKRRFSNIEIVLKCQDAPRILVRHTNVWIYYDFYFDGRGLSPFVLFEIQKRMRPKRFYLLMQLLCIYLRRRNKSAAKCLRLLWNSVPDVFFSFEEIKMALREGLSFEAIEDVYNFYSSSVGVFHACFQPRSLKHLCRPTVRGMLTESHCWIPDGVKQIDIPIELQSFLNLED